jgi:dihydrofolate synthase/folylpolyglutamate synthase
MNFKETLQYLYSALPMYQRVGKSAYKKNLDNTLALCKALGNPQDQFKSVHVAGTNGKGSSSHMIAAISQSAGYRTGLYTSPHLKSFTERIRVNGEEISEQAVVDFVNEHKALIQDVMPSFFEITVVMAFEYFAKQAVDIAIIEVGLGGRLDSTNVIMPEVCLITNIGLDHEEMLGPDLASIAAEKAGIMKTGIPVVIGRKQAETTEVFRLKSSEVNAPMIFATDHNVIHAESYDLQLKGDYQWSNVPGVLSVVEQLNHVGFNMDNDQVRHGLAHTIDLTNLKGRWQVLNDMPLTICDTGHNLDGVAAIVQQINKTPHNDLFIVWGMVDDKDATNILKLLPKDAYYYFCKADVPRAKNAPLLYEEAISTGLSGEVMTGVNDAISAAKQRAKPSDLIFIGGSTFVVAEIEEL